MSETQPEENKLSPMEELFSRDPNGWTEDDVSIIVSKLRENRKNFVQAEHQVAIGKAKTLKGAKKAADALSKPAKAAKPKKVPFSGEINLASLGIMFVDPVPVAEQAKAAPPEPTIKTDTRQLPLLPTLSDDDL